MRMDRDGRDGDGRLDRLMRMGFVFSTLTYMDLRGKEGRGLV